MKKTTTNLLSTKFLAFVTALFCLQASAQQLPRVTQFEEDEVNISLDGLVEESVWQSIPAIDGMKRMDPDTLEDAPYKTDIRFFYTDRGLYFGIINHQPAESVVSRLAPRDTTPFDFISDSIRVYIDASGEGRYGYGFGLNLGDAMSDISILPEQCLLRHRGAYD